MSEKNIKPDKGDRVLYGMKGYVLWDIIGGLSGKVMFK